MTRRTIEELLEFINRFSYEKSLDWNIKHLYDEDTTFEIQWLYDKSTDLNFYIKRLDKSKDEVWMNTNSTGLLEVMIDEKSDLAEFELQLLKVIGVQVVCCHYYIERSAELIGPDKVNQIIKLIDEITSEDKKKETPRLKVVPRKKSDD